MKGFTPVSEAPIIDMIDISRVLIIKPYQPSR